MKRLDKAISGWAIGAHTGRLGPYTFYPNGLGVDGFVVARRLRDINNKNIIIIRRDTSSGALLDNEVDPDRHFKKLKHITVGCEEFFKFIKSYDYVQQMIMTGFDPNLSDGTLFPLGQELRDVCDFGKRHGIVFLDDPRNDDLAINAAIFLYRHGHHRYVALGKTEDHFGMSTTVGFSDWDKAIYEKMRSGDQMKLYDLSV